jgi:ABC-2 type transport system permease protein
MWLLFELRLLSGLNRGRGGKLLSALGYGLSALPAVGLTFGFFRLERVPFVAHSMWSLFILTLSAFVTTCLFVTWPLLSAGVDDHGEISRFAAIPISSRRLVWTSMLATLLEPRALVLTSPVVGASLGFFAAHHRPTPFSVAVLAVGLVGYLLLNGAWSRAVAHAAINVLKDKRSAELIGTGFLLFLLVASQIPPVDTGWLTNASGAVFDRLGADVIRNAALALVYVPSGFFVGAMLSLHAKASCAAFLLGEWLFAWLGGVVAHRLLLRFHRRARGQPARAPKSGSDPFASAKSLRAALFRRELVDLWRNPRARLLATVPFVLAILLKLLSAHALAVYLLGEKAEVALLGGLSVYGALVMTSTFAQNAFGYDGRALRAFLASPVPLGEVLAVKNRVHALAWLLLSLATLGYARLYFGFGSLRAVLIVALGVLCLLPVLLASGNFLSVYFPVKFHETLERRDRLPLAAVSLGMAAASLGVMPLVLAVRRGGVTWGSALCLSAVALAAWALYAVSLKPAKALLEARQEKVLAAVEREGP